MKPQIFWILLIPTALGAGNYTTTNRIEAHSDFKEVDGKLYNIQKSKLWAPVEGARIENRSPTEILAREFKVVKHGHYVGGSSDRTSRIGGGFSDLGTYVLDWEQTNWGKYFILKNFAGGDPIRVRALSVGTVSYENQTIPVFDCGVPHVVSVVRTNSIPERKSKS
jgi:hypothetical protein